MTVLVTDPPRSVPHRAAVRLLRTAAAAEADFARLAYGRDDVESVRVHRSRRRLFGIAVAVLTGAPRVRVWRSPFFGYWHVDLPVREPGGGVVVRTVEYPTAEAAWAAVGDLLDAGRGGMEPPC